MRAGWLCKIEAGEGVEKELDALMTEEEYTVFRESEGGH